jgi:hypothetical protein
LESKSWLATLQRFWARPSLGNQTRHKHFLRFYESFEPKKSLAHLAGIVAFAECANR